jgi:hypothetical protein
MLQHTIVTVAARVLPACRALGAFVTGVNGHKTSCKVTGRPSTAVDRMQWPAHALLGGDLIQ